MTERSVFWTTDGTGHGTSGGYPQDRIYDWLRKMFQPGQEAVAGPLWGEGDYLSISGSSLPLTVQEGCALGYGAFYENTADFSVSGTFTPSIGTTGGRINLVLDYSAQTAKIQANQSADGVATLPSLTQSAGVTWEVPLYTYTVTTGGVVTLTDVRAYPYFATKVKTLMIDDGAITLAKMAANSVDSDQYVDGSIDTAHLADGSVTGPKIAAAVAGAGLIKGAGDVIDVNPDGTTINISSDTLQIKPGGVDTTQLASGAVTLAKMAANSVDSDNYVDGSIDTAHIAADAVDDTKVGNRVPQFYRRQGGDASDWSVTGSTTYTPTTLRMQAGIEGFYLGAGNYYASKTITLPVAFSDEPLVFITPSGLSHATGDSWDVQASALSASQIIITIYRSAVGSPVQTYVSWLAIGPE